MGITDELRELAHMFSNVWLDKDGSVTYTTGTSAPSLESVNFEKHIKDIADRIDAEHQKELENARAIAGVYGFDCGFASADDWFVDHSEELEEHGWVQLPKDADDVPWHLNDRDEYGGTVTAIKLAVDGFWIRVGCTYKRAEKTRHYHAPTVEDVLREFTDAILDWAGKSGPVAETGTWSDVAAEFAKRLKLAGDAE